MITTTKGNFADDAGITGGQHGLAKSILTFLFTSGSF